MDQVILDQTVTDVVTFDDGSVVTLVQQNFDVVTVGGEQGPPGRDGSSGGLWGYRLVIAPGSTSVVLATSNYWEFDPVVAGGDQVASLPDATTMIGKVVSVGRKSGGSNLVRVTPIAGQQIIGFDEWVLYAEGELLELLAQADGNWRLL